MFDNVKHTTSSGDIESLITADYIDGHRLHHGDARRLNNITWSMTANGVSLSRDLADRSVLIKVGKPKRTDWVTWAWRFIDKHRAELLADIIAELQAEPRGVIRHRNRDRWAAWQDGVLSRLPNADELAALIIERRGTMDADADDWADVRGVIEDLLHAVGADPTCPTFIPSTAICQRLEAVTGERYNGKRLSATLDRFAGVGDSKRLQKNKSNRQGRGYVWLPHVSPEVSPSTHYPDWQSVDAKAAKRVGW